MDAEVMDSVLIRSGPDDFGISRITFNRPEKANAINAELAHDLLQSIRSVAKEGCKSLIIQGAGKHFCAGFDFDGYELISRGDLIDRFIAIEEALQMLRSAPFISIAIVQGAAFGAGADIAASSTYRVGSDRARFRFPGFQFGVALGTRHLAQVIGMQRARRILLENALVECDEALEIGLLTHREQASLLRERAEILAKSAASLDPISIQGILRLTSNSDFRADMAELVQSLSRPGLHERIGQYRHLTSGR